MVIRSRFLWPCAAILGVAAGLNFARLNASSNSAFQEQGKSHGFADGRDYLDIGTMLNNEDLRSIDDRQMELLKKYAAGPGNSPDYVAGVLNNIHSDPVAVRTIPIAIQLKKRLPDRSLVLDLPKAWSKNGCASASQTLSTDPAWKSQGDHA